MYSENVFDKRCQERMVKEGMDLWKKQQEYAKYKKLYEQKQAREMMRYWPWGQGQDNKPRGLRNLRLEGLFPHNDMEKAKRMVGGLDMGRPGGGAPNVNALGKKVIRTKEDPILRFQWGKDLRQTVDNTLRYRRGKLEQEEYKKDLDKLVEEKLKQKEKEKLESLAKDRESLLMSPPWGRPGPGGTLWRDPGHIGKDFFYSLGWTDPKKLNQIQKRTLRPLNRFPREKLSNYPRNRVCNYVTTGGPLVKRAPLSPLRDSKDYGIELVPLMVEKRAPLRIPLGTTDVTRYGYSTNNMSKWAMDGQKYLKELSNQMNYKRQHLKEIQQQDMEGARKHFDALDAFWGRPGHGAPRSALKKGCIQKLLYPKWIAV